ncbi:hypothetical protein Enr13x_28880 [Stieleria neptunia]|uniref:Cytochrome c domain-containing protein n=1 Tax=Stieleria neptunia TaxID=2527979 RepID=A0A518HQA7_9BACT|nr:hypothetical protein [Stieleria neptunia]QDV43036.1 hypothetical protein Enr13x_28880 [Stieleria neptunia]
MPSGDFELRIALRLVAIAVCCIVPFGAPAGAQINLSIDIEKAPFEYSQTAADNRVSRLVNKLNAKTIQLEYSRETGYLRSLLRALEIPESSQTLVFSKTSMQVRYISRRNPRAIYFNDDTYVGWVRGSSLMEISTADPKLGTAFYTVDMMPWRAKVEQAYYDCLACHATSMTQGVPGHTVRSVYPEVDGSVASQRESFITDHTSPFSQRWGGWYVTGRHGEMRHMGNTFLRGGQLDTRENGNRLSLWDDFETHDYLSPYSDIVALMVLEHQTQMHNAITQADFSLRQLMHQGEGTAERSDEAAEWNAQLRLIAKPVVDYALFCDEAPLSDPVNGSVIFAEEFGQRGPVDSRGRSLRDFDLQTRMFKYPCSYLIYSPAFDSMQKPLKEEVMRQLLAVLKGENQDDAYRHLDAQTRADTLAILRETKPDLFR